jgi:hypothetical protein
MINSDEILLNLEYLDNEIVPPGTHRNNTGDLLKQSLNSMSHTEVTRSKRKFRKLFKKSLSAQIQKIKLSLRGNGKTRLSNKLRLKESIHQLHNRAGLNLAPEEKLDVQHSRYRRVLVHNFLYNQMKNKK